MSIAQLPRLTVLGAVSAAEESLADAASAPTQGLATDEIADSIAVLAVVESRAQSLRMALSAQADARQVANTTADTGTDAWLARLTGDTREALAGGPRLANLLETKYAHVRHAFAAVRLRLPQVRVIVNAAEQAPTEATEQSPRPPLGTRTPPRPHLATDLPDAPTHPPAPNGHWTMLQS